VLILYSVVIIPWRICFSQDATGALAIMDVCVDLSFGVDIGLCFFTGIFRCVSPSPRSPSALLLSHRAARARRSIDAENRRVLVTDLNVIAVHYTKVRPS
jgi:hypothetical protein